jgi:CRISPR-associated protein Cas1
LPLRSSLKPATAPLIYDFEEPYRWLVDYTVLRMILSDTFSWDDFHFAGGTYRLRIHPPLLDRYAELLRKQFNSGIVYEGKRLLWDTLILRKCQELTRYLLGRRGSFDLASPRPILQRSDTRMPREKILSLSQSEARKLGIGKSTLHYLREKASGTPTRSFRVYSKVRKRLMPQSTFSRLERQGRKKGRKGREVRRG